MTTADNGRQEMLMTLSKADLVDMLEAAAELNRTASNLQAALREFMAVGYPTLLSGEPL